MGIIHQAGHEPRRKVEVVDYDPAWPELFDALKGVVASVLGDLALAIEHVGSTSVPGLAAKPVVDMNVVIPSRDLLPEAIARLSTLGYQHEGDLGVPGREAFDLPTPDVPRDGSGREWPRHHLYVCAQDNRELARHLTFRDTLRAHPEQARAYGDLKRELARRFPYDVDAYCEAKTTFIDGILGQAGTMSFISSLQTRLKEKANPKTKAWWERYLKGVIPFRGVKMADIRAALHTGIAAEEIATRLPLAEQKKLALDLFREAHAEDKLAGVLYLQDVLLPQNGIDWRTDLPRFARLFQEGQIYDWNTCDWFCVKVLGPLVQAQGEGCARAIGEWRRAENLWQRRASGVAFVNLAKEGDGNFPGFTSLLLEICAATVAHPQRFAQTGTGWVLRELGRAEQARVIAFIEGHIEHFSAEGLRYAIDKLPAEIKKDLKQQHRRRSG